MLDIKFVAENVDWVKKSLARKGFASASTYLQEDDETNYLHITHLDINSNWHFLKNAKDEQEKKYLLELIIAQCVEIKDILANKTLFVKHYPLSISSALLNVVSVIFAPPMIRASSCFLPSISTTTTDGRTFIRSHLREVLIGLRS